jgi:hypothetical protein
VYLNRFSRSYVRVLRFMRTGREGKKILLLVFAFSHKKEKKEKESTQILEAHKAFWLF